MAADDLMFSCPRCGHDLVVPARAAGVEGPCPKCWNVIRAPRFVGPKVEEPVRLEVSVEPEVRRVRPVVAFQPAPVEMTEAPVAAKFRLQGVTKVLVIVGIAGLVVVGFLIGIGLIRAFGKTPPPVPPMAGELLPDIDLSLLMDALDAPVAEQGNAAPVNAPDRLLDPRVPPDGMDVERMISRSAARLGTMLTAKTLDERMGLIETATPREELEKSPLKGPLPATQSFSCTEVRFNKVEDATDVMFLCGFAGASGDEETHLLLVRTRGSQEPKVVVDPFLDGYGGRLAEFAKRPVKGERTFRTLLTVFDFCANESVPDFASQYTVKLTTHPGGPDVAKAYFGKNSPLTAHLMKSGLNFGRTAGGKFVLRWSESAPPFLELVDVKALDWDD